MISTNNCDIDMKRQMRKFYANINILSRKFSKCSPDVRERKVLPPSLKYNYNNNYTNTLQADNKNKKNIHKNNCP